MIARIAACLGIGLLAVSVGFALPAAVTITTSAKLEILNDGKPGGMVLLKAGEKLAVLEVVEPHVMVRYRNLTGRVFIAQTDLPRPAGTAAGAGAAAVANAISTPVASATVAAAAAPVAAEPTQAAPVETRSEMARMLDGKLVALQNGTLRAVESSRLANVKFYAVYFSAGWCGPCREFTPELIDAYGKIRPMYPEFEVILVNRDRSPADMVAYVRADKMPWPALKWDAVFGTPLNRYAGNGIPCLVLLDENGKVLSDTNRGGRYVGPQAVLNDTWKILKDYRRSHPRPKA